MLLFSFTILFFFFFFTSHSNMSISFSFTILFLIFISLQPCHFSQCLQLDDSKFQKQQLQPPIKGKMGMMVLSWDKVAIESHSKANEEGEIVRSKRPKYKRRSREQLKRVLEELKKVSWEVPNDDDDDHKKVKGNNGVFSSDYEHARTHPPSHN